MANWDHLSNIGTHPVLDPDPRVSLPAKIEAAQRHIDRFTEIRDNLQAELDALDPDRAAQAKGFRSNEHMLNEGWGV